MAQLNIVARDGDEIIPLLRLESGGAAVTTERYLFLDKQAGLDVRPVPDAHDVAVGRRLQPGGDGGVIAIAASVNDNCLASSQRERQQCPQQCKGDQQQT